MYLITLFTPQDCHLGQNVPIQKALTISEITSFFTSPYLISYVTSSSLILGTVNIRGVLFSYETDESGNFLTMSYEDCSANVEQAMEDVPNVKCPGSDEDDNWIGKPMAKVERIKPPQRFAPCNWEWRNAYMLAIGKSSCVR